MTSYERKLNEFLDEIFDKAEEMDMSNKDLAASSGLAYQTVRRIQRCVTRFPRLETVFYLCQAVGMNIGTVRFQGKSARKLKLFVG